MGRGDEPFVLCASGDTWMRRAVFVHTSGAEYTMESFLQGVVLALSLLAFIPVVSGMAATWGTSSLTPQPLANRNGNRTTLPTVSSRTAFTVAALLVVAVFVLSVVHFVTATLPVRVAATTALSSDTVPAVYARLAVPVWAHVTAMFGVVAASLRCDLCRYFCRMGVHV